MSEVLGVALIIILCMKAIAVHNPIHKRLKPGKLNGALSERKVAVRGLKTNGEMILAKELIPDMHP